MMRQNRGIALISTFMFIAMLFMMAVSMIMMSRQRIFTGKNQHQKAQALYLAEAGLAKAQVALETDLDWDGVENASIDGIPGTYSVHFGDDKYGSVNNIGSEEAAPSYRGDTSVPQNSALLIVQANVSGQRYVLESIVKGQGSAGYVTDAILGSGKVRTKGDLKVDGVAALDNSDPVDGSIQSNSSDSSNVVTWDGSGEAVVTGVVGIQGSTASSINMPGASIGGTELNSSAVIPSYDVQAEVDANTGLPAPTFVSGGTTEISGGDYYLSSPSTVNGDIVLKNNATLYINGDFQVNGSIKGKGSVYVTGNTSLKGDSSVTTSGNSNVSLYSKGNVKLTGFDGTEFLKSMGSEMQNHLQVVDAAGDYVEANLAVGGDWQGGGAGNSGQVLWDVGAALGYHFEESDGAIVTFDFGDGIGHTDVLKQMLAELDGTNGDTADFLKERIEVLRNLFTSADDLEDAAEQTSGATDFEDDVLAAFLNGTSTAGFLDTAVSSGNNELWHQAVNLTKQVNFDKLGTSYFQGAIYTNGYFYADNEVNVLGAIIADGNGESSDPFVTKVLDTSAGQMVDGPPVTLNSGDIYLGRRTRVTYVEELFKDDSTDITGPQLLKKRLWMGR
jgi:cytoskeletal protein CcmA (bactofilin family)